MIPVLRPALAPLLALVLALGGCCDDPTSPLPDGISGLVFQENDITPATGATVYLGGWSELGGFSFWNVVDSTRVKFKGFFLFSDLAEGSYDLYAAEVGSPGPSRFSFVTPLTDPIDFDSHPVARDLRLRRVRTGGGVTGQVLVEGTQAPPDSARVSLFRLEGIDYHVVASVDAEADGAFEFTDVCTGNYRLFAEGTGESPFPGFIGESDPFFHPGGQPLEFGTLLLTDAMVEKPAVYIYPEEDGPCQVRLGLNHGTRLTASIPEYGDGWDVFVETTGRIDGKYDYLFYEAVLTWFPDITHGWCLGRQELPWRLAEILRELGLNEAETADFLAYWQGRLAHWEYYQIWPVVDAALDPWVELAVVPAPDSIRRFWLVFRGCDRFAELPPPQIEPFVRNGMTVVEWGGVLLQAR